MHGGLPQSGESGSGGVTEVESVSAFGGEPGAQVVASQLDPSADLVWLFGSFEDEGGAGLVHLAMWGEPDAEWLFSMNAGTPLGDLHQLDPEPDSHSTRIVGRQDTLLETTLQRVQSGSYRDSPDGEQSHRSRALTLCLPRGSNPEPMD